MIQDDDVATFARCYVLLTASSGRMYCGAEGGQLFLSPDDGLSWRAVLEMAPEDHCGHADPECAVHLGEVTTLAEVGDGADGVASLLVGTAPGDATSALVMLVEVDEESGEPRPRSMQHRGGP